MQFNEQRKRKTFSTNGTGMTSYPYFKKKKTLNPTPHENAKNYFVMDCRPKHKSIL